MPVPLFLPSGGSTLDKYQVRLMNQALQDLDEIYCYIARNLQEPGAAAELLDALESEILSLEYLPYRCAERRTGSFANGGYRQLMVKNYIVVYRVDEVRKQVLIVTVRYARRPEGPSLRRFAAYPSK